MPSDSATLSASGAALDFSLRAEPAELPELMDEPCTYEEFRDCLHDLEQVNRLTLAYRPTLRFVDEVLSRHKSREPLHIVDVGCGGGDMLRRIARLAQRKNIPVKLVGIDMNPYARRYVEDLAAGARSASAAIEWITGDAFAYQPPDSIDIIISSLFTHHLATPDIVQFLAWMEHFASVGWFVNDLLRSERSYRLFGLLSRVMRWHPFVQHDGPVSIRRAFRDEDWLEIASVAGLRPGITELQHWNPGRLCVRRLR